MLISNTPDAVEDQEHSPLQIVISLARKCYAGERRFSLPIIVQQLIDAGADVTDQDSSKRISLDIFFDEVLI